MRFPLPFHPALSYKTGGRRYGAERKGGRKHAGCDLIAPQGTPVYAVGDGVVIRGPYHFYRGTYALEIRHDGSGTLTNFIVRYCEIEKVADGIAHGVRVREGQEIAYVGKMFRDSMLHFEMYKNDGSFRGPLTQRNNPPTQRRGDLIDPSPYLDRWPVVLDFSDEPVRIVGLPYSDRSDTPLDYD